MLCDLYRRIIFCTKGYSYFKKTIRKTLENGTRITLTLNITSTNKGNIKQNKYRKRKRPKNQQADYTKD